MLGRINIALLGNTTLDYLARAICDECAGRSITADIYNSPYNQYVQEILKPRTGGLYASNPN